MRALVALVLIGASGYFLYNRYLKLNAPPPAPPPPPPALVAPAEPKPFLSVAELKKVRASLKNPDPGVRWSAMELLFSFKDPDSVKVLSRAIEKDPDPELRMKAIKLLSSTPNPDRVPGLVKGLTDIEKDVKLASLDALGEVADAAAGPWVVEALKDPDPDVKRAALRCLGKLQDRRRKEFQELSDRLRVQYEQAVEQSQKREREQ